MSEPRLLQPLTLGDVTTRNRIMISPMCQYSARDGVANDWHLVHLGKFAQGGAGIVMVEATSVTAEGRITHGDLGLWRDEQMPPLARIAAFVSGQGAVPGIQLAHAGRKASTQRPWFGNAALGPDDYARGEHPWRVVAPSAIPAAEGWLRPDALSADEMMALREAWRQATKRAHACGFAMLEVHCAHGYLLHEFLSPLSNHRTDAYGGDRAARMRFPLEIIETVRAVWPAGKPLSVRISSVDGTEDGWTLADSVAFARAAKSRGVDLIDCSSGGLASSATASGIPRGYGFQVPYADTIRREAGIATAAVGLIVRPQQAEAILADGSADLIALGREALSDPNWPLHAELELRGRGGDAFGAWPEQYGWWLKRRERSLQRLAEQDDGTASSQRQ